MIIELVTPRYFLLINCLRASLHTYMIKLALFVTVRFHIFVRLFGTLIFNLSFFRFRKTK